MTHPSENDLFNIELRRIAVTYPKTFFEFKKELIEQGMKENGSQAFKMGYEQGKIDLLKDIEINLQKDDGYIHISMIKELMKE